MTHQFIYLSIVKMDYEIGTELLIQSPSNTWMSAIVEEDDEDEIFISYIEGNAANEWINKDSHRIKLKNEECPNKLITTPNQSANNDIDLKSSTSSLTNKRTFNTTFTEKEKKPTSGNRLSNTIFKVKFKKDDFLSKKSQDSKHKEQKTIKDNKKSSDSEPKTPLLHNSPIYEKNSSSTPFKHSNVVIENAEMEIEPSTDIINAFKDSKTSNETSVSRAENFEELLEDIEAEAEICSATKSLSHGDLKQKKKKKKYFGQRRRPEKRKKSQKNSSGKKNVLTVKLNSPKVVHTKDDNSLQKQLGSTDDTETSLPKKVKPSLLANSAEENSPNQNSLFHFLANNTLLQKIRMDASDEQGLRCPKQECRKLFRKENLLMMHIKHYHAEYTELLVSTPNVTDLATARIEGENVDELSPSYFLHRISELEAKRSLGNTSINLPPHGAISCSVNPELESNTSQSENVKSTFTSSEKQTSVTQSYDSKDSGFSGTVDSFSSVQETPVKDITQIKEPIKKITLVDDFENETKDNYDSVRAPGSSRHFKIKKNKSEIESLPKEEVIHCSCGSNQEDGLMIQCDVCLCWQHGYCNKIDSDDQVPDNYICSSCLNPSKKRQSKQYHYVQDWIKDGKIASVLQHKDERRKKDENILKQSHQLIAELVEHQNYVHSVLVKTAIYGHTPDHPKLYLWSEQGSKINEDPTPNKLDEILTGPVPEKPINTAECRKNLLDEIEDSFNNVEARLNLFEAKTNGLVDQVNGTVDNEVLSNTVNLLFQDMNSIRHLKLLENRNQELNNV